MHVAKKRNHKKLDALTYTFGVLLPIFTIPQAYTIVVDGETAGVSLITWSFYLIASTTFAIFGYIHKEKLLLITYIPFVVLEAIIVVGLLVN